MVNNIEFSFITPIYNTSKEILSECISSIIKQNIHNYEIILVNDGSTNPQTNQFCEQIAEEIPMVKYLVQPNSGSAVARNKGLELARGKYIVFVDDDDKLPSNYYKDFRNINSEFDVAIFDYCYWLPESKEMHTLGLKNDFSDQKEMLYQSIMYSTEKLNDFFIGSIWAKCFLNSFLRENDIKFVDSLRKAQDRMFMLEVVYKAESIKYFPIYAYDYRVLNVKSVCHKYNPNMDEYYNNLYLEMKGFCNKNRLSENSTKYLEYGIVVELLELVVFHVDNKEGYNKKRAMYKSIIKKYNLHRHLKLIKFRDYNGFKSKIRLLLFKLDCFFVLYSYYKTRNRKRMKSKYKR